MRSGVALLASLVFLVPAAQTRAEVAVSPARAEVGQPQEFLVRVATEGDVETVGVRVVVPASVEVTSTGQPPIGWVKDVERDGGRIVAVEYGAGLIAPGEYETFRLLGTPTAAGPALWQARQSYADGSVREFADAPGAPATADGPAPTGPAAAVEVVEAGALTGAREASGGGLGTVLGATALALALAALALVALLWRRRPAAAIAAPVEPAPVPAGAPPAPAESALEPAPVAYDRSRTQLAASLGLSITQSAALRRHLGIDDDPTSCQVTGVGSKRVLRYSEEAHRRMRAALDEGVDFDAILPGRRPARPRASGAAAETGDDAGSGAPLEGRPSPGRTAEEAPRPAPQP